MKHIGKGNLNQLMSHQYNKKRQILDSYKPAPPRPVGIIPDDVNVIFDTHANNPDSDFLSRTKDWTVTKEWYHK